MIKFVQKNGVINGTNIAWVDILFVDEDGREYPLTIRPKSKYRLNAFLRSHGFKIGVLAEGETVLNKVMI